MEKLIKCPKCGRELTEDKFYRNKSKPGGRSTYCKECTLVYNKSHFSAEVLTPPIKAEKTNSEISTNELVKMLLDRKQDILVNPTPRDLILRLKNLGYEGTLEYTERKVISLKNFN